MLAKKIGLDPAIMASPLITTIVDVREEVFGMTLASAQVKQGEQVLAETEIKIAIKGE